MDKEKFLIVGSGGREAAFALKLAPETSLYAVISHENPTIVECVQQSAGEYLVADESDPDTITEFAVKHHIDYAFINSDKPLANGVVDALLERHIKTIGGTKAGSRIEWDKIYSIEMMQSVCPEYTPYFKVISQVQELEEALHDFEMKNLSVVVKPQGLTGGKGVKVMPEHLKTYSDCALYAKELFETRPTEKVLLVEKLEGIEFTVMGFTDGNNLVLAPASYDYPFRYEGDTGPGTGGMGCFTNAEKKLPFMNDEDLEACRVIMQSIIQEIQRQDLFFKGVLNGGFFKTAQGIRFMEFNSRFGDPEGLNILMILRSSFSDLLKCLWNETLSEENAKFIKQASVVKYLVAKEYPAASNKASIFTVDKTSIEEQGITLFFASCVQQANNNYITLKKSRVLALGTTAQQVENASQKINRAIQKFVTGPLEYRADIGLKSSLNQLTSKIT